MGVLDPQAYNKARLDGTYQGHTHTYLITYLN